MARKRSKKRNWFLDVVDILSDLGLKLCGVVFVVVLVYLAYGLLSKNGLGKLGMLPLADQQRVVANISTACQILLDAGIVVAVCVVIRYYMEDSLGYLMSILGVVLYFGVPFGFSIWFSQVELTANRAIAIIVSELQLLGIALFLFGVALIVRELALRMINAYSGRRGRGRSFLVGDQIRGAEGPFRPRLYPQCWQTHYCRSFVRKVCPAFEKRRSCWKIKTGCFCDETTIMRAMAAESKEGQLFARELNFQTGSLKGAAALSAAKKRQRCRTCVIYLYHQHQKYKLISPLVFPITAILTWLFYSQIVGAFTGLVNFTDRFMKMVSFLPQVQDKVPGGFAIPTVPEAIQILFVIWLMIMVVSYSLHFIEYCIFRLQI